MAMGQNPAKKAALKNSWIFYGPSSPETAASAVLQNPFHLQRTKSIQVLLVKKKNMSFLSESHFFFGILKLDTPVCSAALRLEIYTLYDMGSWMETSGMVETAPKRWEKAIAGWLMIIYG